MAGWDGRIEELLYEGESVRETVAVDGSRVVVTSHRVLAVTPGTEGANVSHVDRPNVDGVESTASADTAHLVRAVQAGVVGAVLIGAGWLLDFGAMVGDVDVGASSAGRLGMGGVLEMLRTLLAVLRNLDAYMQLLGALALLLAVGFVAVYWWGREQTLVIRVAGGDDIHLPGPPDETDAVERLERAIVPGGVDDAPDQPNRSRDPLDEA